MSIFTNADNAVAAAYDDGFAAGLANGIEQGRKLERQWLRGHYVAWFESDECGDIGVALKRRNAAAAKKRKSVKGVK